MPLTREESRRQVPSFSEPHAEYYVGRTATSALQLATRYFCIHRRSTGETGEGVGDWPQQGLGWDPGDIHSGYLVRVRATTEQADQGRTGLQLLAVLLPVAGGAAYTRVLAPSLPGVAVLGLSVPPPRMI
jgi:hypothetical protein